MEPRLKLSKLSNAPAAQTQYKSNFSTGTVGEVPTYFFQLNEWNEFLQESNPGLLGATQVL